MTLSASVDMHDNPKQSTVPAAQWCRPPLGRSRCPYTGVSHGTFYAILRMAGNKIRTAKLAPPGAKRGSRLVHVGDLLGFIEQLAQTQQVEAGTSMEHPGEAA